MPWKRPSARTEIVHIVVTSYQKKKYPRKHYVFVIDVTWNNSERYEIFRRYSDFFSFQTTLKALFPVAAGRRNEDRVIPALPKRIFVGRSHVARVAEARLELINRYCQTLISLEPKVSESAHVIGFFSPRIGDTQLPKLHLHRPASLHPQIIPAGSLFEEYCALAEYAAEDDSQISFNSGEKVLVVSKDESGWWMCECMGKVGWAPPSYLKKCHDEDSDDSDSEEEFLGLPENYKDTDTDTKTEATKDSDDSGLDSRSPSRTASTREGFNVPAIEAEEYKAIDSYEAEGPGQISFGEGDIIHVFDKIEDGWWFVSNSVEEGWAPCSYLEPLKEGKEEDILISSLDIEKYTTVDAYTAEEEDELSFPKGVMVDVLQKSLDGWWLVKHKGRTGLTPATFLKKATQVSGKEGARRISPPPQQNFQLIKTYQQPPRKQSVRYRASIKKQKQQAKEKGAGRSPLATSFAAAYQNGVEKHKTVSDPQIEDDDDYVPPAEFQRPKFQLNQLPKVTTPLSSDSEDAAISPPKSPRLVKRNIQNRIRRLENRSTSDSSLSEDSNPPTPTKPPITGTPRVKPQLKPKPKLLNLQNQQDKHQAITQHPTRPSGSEMFHARQIPLIKEQPPMEEVKPHTPARPRGSEIRRAHEKFSLVPSDESVISQRRSPSPSPSSSPRARSPLRALWEESEEESDASIHSNRSSWLRPKRSVSPDPRQQRTGRSQTDAIVPPVILQRSKSPSESAVSSLAPVTPQRAKSPSVSAVFSLAPVKPPQRAKSPSESAVSSLAPLKPPQRAKSPSESEVPSSSPSSSSNPFNEQMADTLIKYILASNDPSLRSALRDIVVSNPQVVKALME